MINFKFKKINTQQILLLITIKIIITQTNFCIKIKQVFLINNLKINFKIKFNNNNYYKIK